MRLRLPLLVAGLALAACGSSSARSASRDAAAAAHRSSTSAPAIGFPCGLAGARTLAASKTARVYVTEGNVYGCSAHSRTSYLLGTAGNCNRTAKVGVVIVTRELSAYALQRCGVDFGSASVIVRRLSDGKRLRTFPATRAGLPEAFQSVRSLALKSDAAVAWIGVIDAVIRNRRAIEVHKADARRPNVLLDSGGTIAPGSLRLHRSTLTWKHGAATRSATLT